MEPMSTTAEPTRQHFGRRSRVFAALYDRMAAMSEPKGMRDRRARVLEGARGRVLEIGAGTGLNLPLYPGHIDDLTVTEPSPPMHRRLQARADELGSTCDVVRAGADRLPFPDESFDTVVSTLVLCTVPDQAAALAEIRRVLKPDGRLLFVEHVVADDPGTERWQRRLQRPWRHVADGCDCHRDTLAGLRAAFGRVEHRDEDWDGNLKVVRKLIVGVAHPV